MKLYDEENKRLIILEQEANSEYWDKHWQTDRFLEKVTVSKNNRFVKKFTKKLLQLGSKVIEGGCGIGLNVLGLRYLGFDVYGVDFAENTISKIKEAFPDLKVSVQDVRRLDFPDNFFDGYWSLGVIEHFWEGYEEILSETERVIKERGYLFLSFPYLSPLRKFKIKFGVYASFERNQRTNNFYQFVLDAEKVKADVEKYGFKLVLKHPFDATKGLKDEISIIKPFLQKLYNNQSIVSKGLRFLVSTLFSRVAAHNILLIFRKL
ncbi:MAG: class I SAM-dependent methyltransferase [Candidatus Scalindua sp.]